MYNLETWKKILLCFLYNYTCVRTSVSPILQETEFVTTEQITGPFNAGFCSWCHDSQEGNPIINAPVQTSRVIKQGEEREPVLAAGSTDVGQRCWRGSCSIYRALQYKYEPHQGPWYSGQVSSLVTFLTSGCGINGFGKGHFQVGEGTWQVQHCWHKGVWQRCWPAGS